MGCSAIMIFFNKGIEKLKKVNLLRQQSYVYFYLLFIALIAYLSFCFIFVFPNHYFVSDFNIRLSSLVIETIVFISLFYSILSRKIKLGIFWVCITIAIGCFLLGNFISAFQVLNLELPIQNFNISDVFLLFFLLFLL